MDSVPRHASGLLLLSPHSGADLHSVGKGRRGELVRGKVDSARFQPPYSIAHLPVSVLSWARIWVTYGDVQVPQA